MKIFQTLFKCDYCGKESIHSTESEFGISLGAPEESFEQHRLLRH